MYIKQLFFKALLLMLRLHSTVGPFTILFLCFKNIIMYGFDKFESRYTPTKNICISEFAKI